MQYMYDLLLNDTLQTYLILLINVTPINFNKKMLNKKNAHAVLAAAL